MRRLSWLAATVLLGACGAASEPVTPTPPPTTQPPTTQQPAPGLDPSIFPKPGATQFMSANERELLSSGAEGAQPGRNGQLELSEDSNAKGAGAPGTSPPAPTEPKPDPSREIVEADIFKLEGNLLYVLNRYRGLVIIDVTNPDQMVIKGRLPFQAVPVEMYVRDGRAYVVNTDYFTYWQYDPEADPHGFHGSQVLIVDVSNPARPKELGSLKLEGEVTDTRMVGDVLYTVSKRRPDYWRYNTADWEDRTWIVSLNVADPAKIREIDRITFRGTSTLIHVAHHAIFVAAWDPNFYLTNPGLEQETLVTYVDISDAAGKLKERGKVYIPGQIADKFKMDWHDRHLRVLSQRWSSSDTITLHVVATAHPDQLKIDTTLDLAGVKRSGLQATRFAGPRAFAFSRGWDYNLTWRRLHTVDLSQPLQPRLAGQLDVSLDATHVEVHADRLLVLGSHYQKGSSTYGDTRTALALFDVANLGLPTERSLVRLGEGWSSSAANYNYKALKTFPALGLILVPLQYWTNGTSFTGLQLVDWASDRLTQRGRVENVGGVTRAFPVGNRLVAVGEMAAATIDATNRDQPKVTRQLKLVHRAHDVFDVKGLQVQLVTDAYSGQVRLETRAFAAEDDGPTLATLNLPFTGAPFVLRDGDSLHLIGNVLHVGQVVHNADLTDPKNPKLRGNMVLTDAFQTIFHPGWGWYTHYWSPYAGLPLRNQIVPATFREVVTGAGGRRDWRSELRFLDLRDLDNPRIASGKVPMNEFPFVNKVTHGNILYSTHVEQATSPDGASLLYHVRSYVDRVDVSDPDHPKALPSVNVPGYLVDVSDDGTLWYTVDFQWDDSGRRRNSLNALKLVGGTAAKLISVVPVSDQIKRAALRPGQLSEHSGRPAGWSDRTIWLNAHKYPWWGVKSDTVSSRQPYTVLRRLDFAADGTVASEQQTSFEGYHFDLLDVQQTQVYLSSATPSGLLVVDVANFATPAIKTAARTIDYVSRIAVNGPFTYAPLGMYGVHRY
ncbi:MAG: beta-propeller domain-containing protein [Deltaproteobacteria bacterium]|nr:beta-propeller domain-containing protein [Deltaproteobacteria bacterium]